MRSGCRGFESRSGHLIFSSICSVYIDRHIRVDLSDDEHSNFDWLIFSSDFPIWYLVEMNVQMLCTVRIIGRRYTFQSLWVSDINDKFP